MNNIITDKNIFYGYLPRSRGKQNKKLESIPYEKYLIEFERIFKSKPPPGYQHYYIVPALVLSLSDDDKRKYMEYIGKILVKYGYTYHKNDYKYIHFIIEF